MAFIKSKIAFNVRTVTVITHNIRGWAELKIHLLKITFVPLLWFKKKNNNLKVFTVVLDILKDTKHCNLEAQFPNIVGGQFFISEVRFLSSPVFTAQRRPGLSI